MLLMILFLFFKLLTTLDVEYTPYQEDLISKLDTLHHTPTKKNESAVTTPKIGNDGKPSLVRLEFPPEFLEKEGPKIIGALEKQLNSFLGNAEISKPTGTVSDIKSPDRVLDYLGHMDFHNSLINYFVRSYVNNLKKKESISMEGIKTRKDCKRACFKKQNGIFQYLRSYFQSIVSTFTQEDLRFEIQQDPKKCFKFIIDPQTKEPKCHCQDDGYIIKVSPRIQEIFQTKFFCKSGDDLIEEFLKKNPSETLTSLRNKLSLKNIGYLVLQLSGWKKLSKRDDDDFFTFIFWHGIVLGLLFFFCHCFFYIYFIYVVFEFFNTYVL